MSRALRPRYDPQRRNRKIFLFYSLYSWGSPAVISVVMTVMFFLGIPDEWIEMDPNSCYYLGYGAVWAYEKGPGLVLSIANTILLVYTIVNIVKAQCCDTAILSNAGNSRHGGTTCFKGNSRVLRATRDDATRRKRKRFLLYSLYVWGCPTVIIVTMAVMEFTPGYGGQWAYKYGPLILLSIANTALMVYTIVHIAKTQCCDTAILNDGGNSRHDGSTCLKGNTRWIVYINLLCLMGPPRVVFIACWAVYMNGVALDWNFVSTLHYCTWLLQATGLFLFICCRPRIPRLLLLRVKILGLLLVVPLTKRSDKKHGPTADSRRPRSEEAECA